MKRTCIKCGHKWNQRNSGIPRICPKCKTRKWTDAPVKSFDKTVRCMKCGYSWLPRTDTPPVVCPKCMDPRWYKQRRTKKEKVA